MESKFTKLDIARIADLANGDQPLMGEVQRLAFTAQPVKLPESFYGVIQDGKVVMLPADDGQWLNKTKVEEGFRALEQRAEAAEAYAKSLNDIIDTRERDLRAAEAKLAELEKQEPVAYRWEGKETGKICYDGIKPLGVYSQELFTRPAPAVSLEELVPKQVSIRQAIAALENHEYCDTPASGYKAGVKDTISAILRNIEEVQ